MTSPCWLLALPLYLGWYCLGHVASPRASGRRPFHRLAYAGAVLGLVGVLLPAPWLAAHALLPAAPAWGLALWLGLLLGGGLYPLLAWLLARYSVPALRRGLLWTADVSVVTWLLCA